MGKTNKLQDLIHSDRDIEVVRVSNERFRVGYCSQCGACCKTINMDTKGTQVAIDWLTLHNAKVSIIGKIERDPREEAKEFTFSVSFPCQCSALVYDDSNQNYTCNVYNDRPIICKMYPKNYTGYKTCTYNFINAEELNIFSKEYTEYWRKAHGKEKKIRITNR
jgi:Fe-S-cluster containining protein